MEEAHEVFLFGNSSTRDVEEDYDETVPMTMPDWDCLAVGHSATVFVFPVAIFFGVVGHLLTAIVYFRCGGCGSHRRDVGGRRQSNRKSSLSSAGDAYVVLVSVVTATSFVARFLPWWLAAADLWLFFHDETLCRWVVFIGQTISFTAAWYLVALAVERFAAERWPHAGRGDSGWMTSGARSPAATAVTSSAIFLTAVGANLHWFWSLGANCVEPEDVTWLVEVFERIVPAVIIAVAAIPTAHAQWMRRRRGVGGRSFETDRRHRRRPRVALYRRSGPAYVQFGDDASVSPPSSSPPSSPTFVAGAAAAAMHADTSLASHGGVDRMTSMVCFCSSAVFGVVTLLSATSLVIYETILRTEITCRSYTAYTVLFIIVVFLPSVNLPFYCLVSSRFRRELVQLFCCCCRRFGRRGGRVVTSSSSEPTTTNDDDDDDDDSGVDDNGVALVDATGSTLALTMSS